MLNVRGLLAVKGLAIAPEEMFLECFHFHSMPNVTLVHQ